ncbi:MAG: tetratricopeptide repeat protein [Gemmatimonadota bacterium]|nr:tetratricopeptide repeat protein [Gemmatimonadota bacterium]MDE2863915.1 tetratricopeptide repeat protein [Gemmatimonadota bacterium]
MINSRLGLALAVAGAVVFSGCASGGGGGGGAAGDAPGENDYTRSAELYLTQAQSLGMPERYTDALNAAMNSIMDDSTNARGYFLAARAQVGLADYVAADTLFDVALELYPGYDQEIRVEREGAWINLFNEAIGPLDAGDNDEGIRLLEAAEVVFNRQRPEALINLGVTYNNAGRPDDAIAAYEAALEVIRGPAMEAADSATAVDWQSREQSVTMNMALLLSNSEQYDEAAAAYEAYLASNPSDMSALANLASVLSQAGQADSAQAIYDNLLSAQGLGMRDYFNIGAGLYNAEVYDQAAEAFRHIVDVAPENRDAVFNLAQSLYEGEDWETLIPIAEELVELDGYNYDSYLILSRALLMSGSGEAAQEVYTVGEGLAFQLANTQFQPRTDGASVVGEFVNKTLEPGTTVTIRVHFNGMDGAEIGTTDIRVDAPAQEAAELFRADFSSNEEVLGYYYEVIGPN